MFCFVLFFKVPPLFIKTVSTVSLCYASLVDVSLSTCGVRSYTHKMNAAHVCCIFSLSSLRRRSRCWVPHTCLCSCTRCRTHLQHMGLHRHLAHTQTDRHGAGSGLTPLTPLPCVAFRAGADVVPPALASVLTGGAAHGCKAQRPHADHFHNVEVWIFIY